MHQMGVFLMYQKGHRKNGCPGTAPHTLQESVQKQSPSPQTAGPGAGRSRLAGFPHHCGVSCKAASFLPPQSPALPGSPSAGYTLPSATGVHRNTTESSYLLDAVP